MRVRASTAENSLRESRARSWLQTIDSLLDIRWIPVAVTFWDSNEDAKRYEGRYALVMHYREHDPALAEVNQSGAPAPFETLGWFCSDMTTAESLPLPCDEMEPKVRSYLGKMDSIQRHVRYRMQDVLAKNAKLTHDREEDFKDEALQRALDVRRSAFDIPYITAGLQL